VSEENVEVVKRVDALLRAGDVEGALGCFHPNTEWRVLEQQRELPTGGSGIDSLRSRWMPFEDAPEDAPDRFILGYLHLTSEVGEYIDADACVVTVDKDLHAAAVYEFEEGKIVRSTEGYPNKAAALRAVGPEA
jgi:ketosteroid isomerase-like protein